MFVLTSYVSPVLLAKKVSTERMQSTNPRREHDGIRKHATCWSSYMVLNLHTCFTLPRWQMLENIIFHFCKISFPTFRIQCRPNITIPIHSDANQCRQKSPLRVVCSFNLVQPGSCISTAIIECCCLSSPPSTRCHLSLRLVSLHSH